jgi:hypothetical protein
VHSLAAAEALLRGWLLGQPTPRFHGASYHNPGLLNIEAATMPRSARMPRIESGQADIPSAQWIPNLPDLQPVKYDRVHTCPRHSARVRTVEAKPAQQARYCAPDR